MLMAVGIMIISLPPLTYSNPYYYKVIRVVDGDTVILHAPFLPDELGKTLYLRIKGIDTPELGSRAKCKLEAELAIRAKLFTEEKIHNASSKLVFIDGWDKYGGRMLGELRLNNIPLSQLLLEIGLAVPYSGSGERKDWCNG